MQISWSFLQKQNQYFQHRNQHQWHTELTSPHQVYHNEMDEWYDNNFMNERSLEEKEMY